MEFKPKGKTNAPVNQTVQRQAERVAQVPQLPVRIAEIGSLQRLMQPAVTEQRQVIQPVFQAASLQRTEDERLSMQRQAVTQQASQFSVPSGAIQAALQRQQQPTAPVPLKPQSAGDWVTVMCFQAEQADGRRMSTRELGQFTALQRQVAQTLTQGYLRDRQPALQRQQEYARHIATLQRHPISGQVSQVFMRGVPAGERPALQRAVDEVIQREAIQRQQDEQALQLHSLQRQLAELDHEATQPVFQRIQARRGSGNPLPEAVQRHLEQGLNHDLSGVRIHDDAEADKMAKGVNAIAFTTGKDIFFQSGKFNPNTQSGLELLAHEVTHTVQQAKGEIGPGIDPSSSHETQAQNMGRKLAQQPFNSASSAKQARVSTSKPISPSGGIQRKPATSPAKASFAQKAALVQAFSVYLRSAIDKPAADSPYLRSLAAAGQTFGIFYPPGLDQQGVINLTVNHFEQSGQSADLMTTLRANGGYQQLIRLSQGSTRRALTVADIGGTKQLTFDAFIEQLASNLSYANRNDFKDDKSQSGLNKNDGKGQDLLKVFGYASSPVFLGRWGMQMRVFYPTKPDASRPVVLTFRGTEGVAFPYAVVKQLAKPGSGTVGGLSFDQRNESEVDTATDMSRMKTAYTMYDMNTVEIEKAIGFAKTKGKSLLAAGHSLGGGLAQIAAARHPGLFGQLYTFQAPGISKEGVREIEKGKTQTRNYRMTWDVVPTANQGAFAGDVFTFEDPALKGPSKLKGVQQNHVIPILSQFLAGMQQDGMKLDKQQQALRDYGKRAVNETPTNAVTTRFLGKGQDVPIMAGEAGKAIAAPVGFSGVMNNAVANNLVYNLLIERARQDLKAIPATGGVQVVSRKLRDVVSWAQSVDPKSLGLTADARRVITDYATVNPDLPQGLMKTMLASDQAAVRTGGNALFKSEGQARYLEVILAMKTGDFASGNVSAILTENRERFIRDLPSLWFSLHPDGAAIYEQLVQAMGSKK